MARCLRFKAPSLSRRDARLASDCAATLYRVGFAPTGPAMKSFSFVSVHIAFSFRELTWRNPRVLFLPLSPSPRLPIVCSWPPRLAAELAIECNAPIPGHRREKQENYRAVQEAGFDRNRRPRNGHVRQTVGDHLYQDRQTRGPGRHQPQTGTVLWHRNCPTPCRSSPTCRKCSRPPSPMA